LEYPNGFVRANSAGCRPSGSICRAIRICRLASITPRATWSWPVNSANAATCASYHVPTEDIEGTCYGCYREEEVKSAVAKRQKAHEDELLGECDTGREVLRLRQEQEDLLDTVWLASSPSQLKTLWSKVNALLGTTPTQLERDALAIPPVDGE